MDGKKKEKDVKITWGKPEIFDIQPSLNSTLQDCVTGPGAVCSVGSGATLVCTTGEAPGDCTFGEGDPL